MIRALLWVAAGLLVLVLGMLATAPELLGDVSLAGSLVVLAFAAVLPGTVALVVAGAARRRRTRAEEVAAAASPTSDPTDDGSA